MSTKYDMAAYYTDDMDDFLNRVWPEFLQNFELNQRTVSGGLTAGNFSASLLLQLGGSGIPTIFIPTMIGPREGPDDDGWIHFNGSSARRFPSDVTINKVDVWFQNKLPNSGTIVIRNTSTSVEGSILINTSDSAFTAVPVSPAVTFATGQGLAVRATGGKMGSGVTISLFGE